MELLEGTSTHMVKLAPSDGAIVEDETRAVEGDDVEERRALGAELAGQEAPLQRGLGMMIAQYGEPALDEVELEMLGAVLVIEAAVFEGEGRSVRVHDPASGHYIMTED